MSLSSSMVGTLSFVMEYWVYAAIDVDRNEVPI
jgi:hypothetical protein